MSQNIAAICAILFAMFALVQIVYQLWFFLRMAIHANKQLSHEASIPVSVIICAKNEENNLRERINAWLNQKYHLANGTPNFELLLVDDNSEDGSAFFYNELRNKNLPHVRILQLRQEAKGIKGKKFPLSMGIKEAKYEALLLTDADCTPDSDYWIQGMMQHYAAAENKQIVLGYGRYDKATNFLNKWIRWETAHTAIQYFSYALAGVPYMGVGRNLSYKRPLFLANKGFSSHSQLISGDDDLFINQVANKNNVAISLLPETFTSSAPKTSYETWWFQKSRHVGTARMYQWTHRLLLGLYSFSHAMFWLLLIPALFCKPLLLITLGLFAARFVIHWIIAAINLIKLHERDLVLLVPLFDILTLYYNVRLFPQLFRSKDLWK